MGSSGVYNLYDNDDAAWKCNDKKTRTVLTRFGFAHASHHLQARRPAVRFAIRVPGHGICAFCT